MVQGLGLTLRFSHRLALPTQFVSSFIPNGMLFQAPQDWEALTRTQSITAYETSSS